MSSVAEPFDESAKDIDDRAKELRTADAGSRIGDVMSLFADQLAGVARTADGYVRSSPWQAVGAAALAGVAAGILVTHGARARRRAMNEDGDSLSEVSGG